ncbi:hypothetical protein CYLTODRAFT_494217 [Cylindrobasidium torrendii FP15055 ss-10]|uniref:Signal recognition particle receptor alpha subunit N-terminal domain-containing protein n=1 Tax=Cylindrobasidium torrendii FP15055 ss-10 TaxID=1314674 RepID=A0A0D7B0J4_9AGAR|nr:hypothetical protein CYLTODRAFT_494217 [Cylindrobasidium torrendii FP15055 ss-10]
MVRDIAHTSLTLVLGPRHTFQALRALSARQESRNEQLCYGSRLRGGNLPTHKGLQRMVLDGPRDLVKNGQSKRLCVAPNSAILQLTYVEELLDSLKTISVELFWPFLTAFVASVHAVNQGVVEAVNTLDISKALEGWDKTFDRLLKGLEDKDRSSRLRMPAKAIPVAINPPSDDPSTTAPVPIPIAQH